MSEELLVLRSPVQWTMTDVESLDRASRTGMQSGAAAVGSDHRVPVRLKYR